MRKLHAKHLKTRQRGLKSLTQLGVLSMKGIVRPISKPATTSATDSPRASANKPLVVGRVADFARAPGEKWWACE